MYIFKYSYTVKFKLAYSENRRVLTMVWNIIQFRYVLAVPYWNQAYPIW